MFTAVPTGSTAAASPTSRRKSGSFLPTGKPASALTSTTTRFTIRTTTRRRGTGPTTMPLPRPTMPALDRKSTRLNSSHLSISYAVFCLQNEGRGAADVCKLERRGDPRATGAIGGEIDFFLNDTAATGNYSLSLHAALPI